MAVIYEINTQNAAIPRELMDLAREIIKMGFWQWYVEHNMMKITTIKWLFVRKTIYVRDLHSVFVMLFGTPSQITE